MLATCVTINCLRGRLAAVDASTPAVAAGPVVESAGSAAVDASKPAVAAGPVVESAGSVNYETN